MNNINENDIVSIKINCTNIESANQEKSESLKIRVFTEEHKENLSKASIGKIGVNKGKTFSDEWCEKISKSNSKPNPKAQTFSQEEQKTICEKYLNGESSHSLSKLMNCASSMILAVLTRNNINIRPNKINQKIEDAICEDFKKEKVKINHLARKFEITKATVNAILKRNGLK